MRCSLKLENSYGKGNSPAISRTLEYLGARTLPARRHSAGVPDTAPRRRAVARGGSLGSGSLLWRSLAQHVDVGWRARRPCARRGRGGSAARRLGGLAARRLGGLAARRFGGLVARRFGGAAARRRDGSAARRRGDPEPRGILYDAPLRQRSARQLAAHALRECLAAPFRRPSSRSNCGIPLRCVAAAFRCKTPLPLLHRSLGNAATTRMFHAKHSGREITAPSCETQTPDEAPSAPPVRPRCNTPGASTAVPRRDVSRRVHLSAPTSTSQRNSSPQHPSSASPP